jgi:S-adenosylmethionine hydrolase
VAGKLEGTIVAVDEAGNLVTDIPVQRLQGIPSDDRVAVKCEGHVTSGIFPADHNQPEMTLLAVQGQSGFLEISLVGASASDFLGIPTGSTVSVTW